MTLASYLSSQFSLAQYLDFFIRIVAACLCGACIGIERSKRLKEAGIRTHVIVCCAAALMMIVSKYGFADQTTEAGQFFNGTRGADPARVAAQVVSGISFLGAGVIFKNGSTIKGLTTAAGIWATAGIGLAMGCGMYILGVFSTVLIALVQVLMHRFQVGADGMTTNEVSYTAPEGSCFHAQFMEYLSAHKIQVADSRIVRDGSGKVTYDLVLRGADGVAICQLDAFMAEHGEVQSEICSQVQ